MKQDKSKIKEPYSPENTPNPPQIIDPSLRKERNENDRPIENKRQPLSDNKREAKEKPKRLGESEIEIDDETTI